MSADTLTIPVPVLAPFGLPITEPETVQDVWDTFVRPAQEAGTAQSIEMRALMAILRAVYRGLSDDGSAGSMPGSVP